MRLGCKSTKPTGMQLRRRTWRARGRSGAMTGFLQIPRTASSSVYARGYGSETVSGDAAAGDASRRSFHSEVRRLLYPSLFLALSLSRSTLSRPLPPAQTLRCTFVHLGAPKDFSQFDRRLDFFSLNNVSAWIFHSFLWDFGKNSITKSLNRFLTKTRLKKFAFRNSLLSLDD